MYSTPRPPYSNSPSWWSYPGTAPHTLTGGAAGWRYGSDDNTALSSCLEKKKEYYRKTVGTSKGSHTPLKIKQRISVCILLNVCHNKDYTDKQREMIRSTFQRKWTILSTTIIIQAVHNYKSGNTLPENISYRRRFLSVCLYVTLCAQTLNWCQSK